MNRQSVLLLAGSLLVIGCGTGAAYDNPYGTVGGTVTCSGAAPVALTVKNYLDWCSVAVGGGPPSSTSQTVCVADGAVSLTATALVGFQLGTAPWHDVDGDTGAGLLGVTSGSGQSETATVTKTVSGTAACAWVCCETAPLGGDCPATDQCP
jgi:hypothetical protein